MERLSRVSRQDTWQETRQEPRARGRVRGAACEASVAAGGGPGWIAGGKECWVA